MSNSGVGTVLRQSALDARRLRMVGDTVSNNRRNLDFYPTPPMAVHALLAKEQFTGTILEPACGDGAISCVLKDAGHDVISTDIVDRGYGESGHDFLWPGYPYRAANIITNPPFKLGEAFVEKALQRADCKVAMLVRLTFLEGIDRTKILEKTSLARIWVFRGRLTFPIPGRVKQSGGMLAFMWAVWQHGHEGPPMIGWIP